MIHRSLFSLLLLSLSISAQQQTTTTTTAPTTTTGIILPQLPGATSRTVTGNQSVTATVSIPQTAAQGGLSFTAPAITAAPSYYKIAPNNPITFGWNFTGLYVTPSSLTFQAYCSENSRTYAVGPATGIPGSATQLIWDPTETTVGAFPYAQATYQLKVFDERGPTALPVPGRFWGGNAIVVFAMYTPAAYTPLSQGWKCVGCSWANPSTTWSHLLIALPVTIALVLIGGAGVFRY